MEDHHTSSEILRQEILDQSEKEIKMILDQAEKETQEILNNARNEEEKVRADNLHKAKIQAEGIRKRILSGVHLEIKRQALRSQEEWITSLFQSVEEKLNQSRSDKAYIPFLKRLIIEGILALDSNEINILSGEIEKKLLNKTLLTQIEKEIKEHHHKKTRLAVLKQSLPEGGVVLVTVDEKMRFDNRFSMRIKRFQNAMRLEAVKKMLGTTII
ncbi:V-type ATP synthase subunit E family protein [bacterium]|nr:V-type ATP synthase subunit E family protein [bacterium]